MNPTPIRVLLVDDSPLALAVLRKLLAACPDIEVVGTAAGGDEALRRIAELNPAVVCTDVRMPGMSGLQLTEEIVRRHPRPVLVVSSVIDSDDPESAFPALAAGAVDVLPKPCVAAGAVAEEAARELASKIRVAAGVRVFRRRGQSPAEGAERGRAPRPPAPVRCVVIGASTGGPPALQAILSRLPETATAPVICVQHISQGFLPSLVSWLSRECRRTISVARPGEVPAPGAVYFPPEDRHLLIGARGQFVTSAKPPVNGHRPSISVTMVSAAEQFGRSAVGILLTGMGEDGADGLLAIRQGGGLTIAQDESTSAVYGMPAQAVRRGAARHVLPLPVIAETVAGFWP